MESVCINCKHFVKVSFNSNTNIWGDCLKPANGIEQTCDEIKGVFKWADGTCPDFEPKHEAGSLPSREFSV